MSEIPSGGPRPDPDDPWNQPIELYDGDERYEVRQAMEPRPEAPIESAAVQAPVASPPKVRHRTRASLQQAATTPAAEVALFEPRDADATARAAVPPQTMEPDRKSLPVERLLREPPVGDDPDRRAYDVGYRRPPKSGQFKPGRSGNPKGRPKGAKNFATVLERELSKPIYITENGRRRRASRREAIVLQFVGKAAGGDLRALLALLKLDTQLSNSNAHGMTGPAPDAEESDQDILEATLAELRAGLMLDPGKAHEAGRTSAQQCEED